MKRIFFLGALLLTAPLSVWARTPWAIYQGAVHDDSFAVDHLIDQRPILYAVSDEVTPAEETIFKENMLRWLQGTEQLIIKSKRTNEFQDVLDILHHGLTLRRVSSPAEANIYLNVTEEPNCGGNIACFEDKGYNPYHTIWVHKQNRDNISHITLHEIGHFYGLADQDGKWIIFASANHSCDVNPQTLMASVAPDLTYDDADGFINLIDLHLAQRHDGKFSKRAQKGWKSLDPDSRNIYQNAQTITRQAAGTWVAEQGDNKRVISRTYKKGTLQEEKNGWLQQSPMEIFYISGSGTILRDPKTHLISSVSTVERQTQATYARYFTYGNPVKKDGQTAIPVSVRETINGKEFNRREVYINAAGELTGIENIYLTKNRYNTTVTLGDQTLSIYLDGDLTDPAHTRYTVLDFNQPQSILKGEINGQMADFVYNGYSESYPMPPQTWQTFYPFYSLATTHMSYVTSFYKNFYEPLFGLSQQQEQIRDQLNKSLSTHR